MALGFCVWRSPYNNLLVDFTEKQDELASPQGLARRSDAGSNKASTPPKALTPPLVPSTKDFFMKFMKVFVESTQTRNQKQAEPWKWSFKARSPEIYLKKSHMDCYHFCQQCKNYFETLDATKMNCTPFPASFFYGIISLK